MDDGINLDWQFTGKAMTGAELVKSGPKPLRGYRRALRLACAAQEKRWAEMDDMTMEAPPPPQGEHK